ncbi:MAG: TIGR04219 family outer membrane beta-barrel protein [Thalassotalea sp.]
MKKTIIAAGLTALMATSAQADTLLGLYVGGSIWNAEASGSFGQQGSSESTFNLEDEKNSNFYAALEHPIPLIPNLKLSSTDLTTKGNGTVDFSFGGADFNGDVNTDIDLSYVDYTLYYEIFDNDLLSIDVGITGRNFDGEIMVSDSSDPSNNGSLDVSGVVPMVYLSTVVGLPFTGFNVFAEGNLLSFDDHTLYDYQAGISYEVLDNIAVDFNINLGYRATKLELSDLDDLNTNLDFKGLFLGAELHF